MSFLSSKSISLFDSTKNIDIVQGETGGNYWICLDLVEDSMLPVFCKLCDDLISCIYDEQDEYRALNLLKNRYNTKTTIYKWNIYETSVLLNSGGTTGKGKIIELSTDSINKLASN